MLWTKKPRQSVCVLLPPQGQQESVSPRRSFGRLMIPSRGSSCSCTKSFTSPKYSNVQEVWFNAANTFQKYKSEATVFQRNSKGESEILTRALSLLRLQLPPAPRHNTKRRVVERFKKSLFHAGSDPHNLKVELSKVIQNSQCALYYNRTYQVTDAKKHVAGLMTVASTFPRSSSRLLQS